MDFVSDPEHRQLLVDLLSRHSTPGDEDEVAARLLTHWASCGMAVRSLGRYGIVGDCRFEDPDKPVMLVCAHMDSPGFAVQTTEEGGPVRLARLGGAGFQGDTTPGVLKSRGGTHAVTIRRRAAETEGERPAYALDGPVECDPGDRVCYAAAPVYPLLIPTSGNHSPLETGSVRDVCEACRIIIRLAEEADDLLCRPEFGASAP